MVTVAMTVLPCACGDHLTRVLLGGRTPVRRRPERWFSPWPPTRPGGGSASRKADGAWCPRRPATLRPLGRQGPRPWRPKGRPGAPWRRAPPGPRVRTREVSRRPPTRDNRLDPQATACATVSHGTDLPASRRGNPESGAVSRASPRRPPPLLPPPRPWKVVQWAHGVALLGPLACGWNCPLECEVHVSASGARRRRAPRSARSSGNPRERRVTAEIVT